MKKSPQQILQEAREEFEKKFNNHSLDCETRRFADFEKEPFADCYCELKEILSWHTSTLQSFIEAEIEREEGEKKKLKAPDYQKLSNEQLEKYLIQEASYINFNQAKEETIPHLKELLETLKR